MHHRLVVLTKPEIKENRKLTSEMVREYTYQALLDEGFTAEGRFSSGVADWFRVGGRWSGWLTQIKLNPLLLKAYEEKVAQIWHERIGKENIKGTEDKVYQKVFKEFFPKFKGECPVARRDAYKQNGASDDAQIVDEMLWKRWLKEALSKCTEDIYNDPVIFLEDDFTDKKSDIVGKCWAVLIDYHT